MAHEARGAHRGAGAAAGKRIGSERYARQLRQGAGKGRIRKRRYRVNDVNEYVD